LTGGLKIEDVRLEEMSIEETAVATVLEVLHNADLQRRFEWL
jgi:hypothetical protein